MPIATRGEAYASQDSLMRILLQAASKNPRPSLTVPSPCPPRYQMRSMQEKMVELLVDKLPEFMHDAPEELEGSSTRDCLVNCFLVTLGCQRTSQPSEISPGSPHSKSVSMAGRALLLGEPRRKTPRSPRHPP
jgi:hypothetical protein